MDSLNQGEKDHVLDIVKEFPNNFYLPEESLTPTHLLQHKIYTLDEVHINTRLYRFTPLQREEVERVIHKIKTEGAIQNSKSSYNLPLLIIPKKIDATERKKWSLVIDFRLSNEKTNGDAYPLPNISDILDHLATAQYFSVFNLARGFHHIESDPKDRQKTAFLSLNRHFDFQCLMDQVLLGLPGTALFVYLDDIVMFAEELEDHGKKVRRLLKQLKEDNLSLQSEKCEFLIKEIAYLGHTISDKGVKLDTKKTKLFKISPDQNT